MSLSCQFLHSFFVSYWGLQSPFIVLFGSKTYSSNTKIRMELKWRDGCCHFNVFDVRYGNEFSTKLKTTRKCLKASSALQIISGFWLLSLRRYLCWWTINPRGHHPPSSRCFGTDMVYQIYMYLLSKFKGPKWCNYD